MTTKEVLKASSTEVISSGKKSEQLVADSVRKKTADAMSEQPAVRSEVLTPSDITPEHLDEVANYFRFTFNNEWPDFAVCPPCDQELPDGMRLSAKQVFGSDDAVPLELMDRNDCLPNCPNCEAKMQVFHDPERTRSNMEKKLKPDGYVSLMRDAEKGGVVGFAFGYGAKLKDGFEYEWGNPYNYMAQPDPKYARSFDHFMTRLHETFPDSKLDPETEIFFWNCVALNPEVRGGGNFMKVMRNMFNALPPEKRDKYIIGEALKGSLAHGLFRTVGGQDVPGVLPDQGIILRLKVGETTDRFNLPPDEFARLRKSILSGDKK